MARWVDKVAQVRSVTWDEAKDSGQISWLGEEVHEAYIERVASLARTQCREGMTVFTGLHGAGRWSVAPVLREAGFSVVEVEDQAEPDGMFPTVPFRAPNPEVRGCMDRAVQVAEEVGADLVMATDPDADRIGAVVRHGGSWRFLTGNEIAVLIVHHALTQGNVSRNPLVIRTEVTTSLVTRIANGLGASVVDHLLVGFKYIGDVLRQLDENGAYGHWTGSPEDFVAGVEESHGVLVSADIRDKDAAGGALFLAEASALALENGQTLVDTLETIWRSYGYVANRLISTVMQGARGSAQIARLMDDLRVNPPDRIGKRKVRKTYDRQDPKGVFGDLLSETDEAARNVLVFELQGEARIVLRPSGTEPKCKVYGEIAQSLSGDLKRSISRANRDLDEVVEDFVMLMLARLGHCVPRWALGSSDLLPLEDKIQFAQVVFPELLVRLETESNSAAEWLDAEMHSFGPDGLALVSGAVDRWLCEHEVPSNLREGLQQLFALMP